MANCDPRRITSHLAPRTSHLAPKEFPMPQLRLCTHIKTNGIKCGSPALRHHTLCYFHYQWQRRDQRRIRLGGPVGMNKNTGIELPLLDGPESIIVSIGEIQHALVDQRIPIKMGTALLY